MKAPLMKRMRRLEEESKRPRIDGEISPKWRKVAECNDADSVDCQYQEQIGEASYDLAEEEEEDSDSIGHIEIVYSCYSCTFSCGSDGSSSFGLSNLGGNNNGNIGGTGELLLP